eukprot:1333453-Rhodomonas_salina.2
MQWEHQLDYCLATTTLKLLSYWSCHCGVLGVFLSSSCPTSSAVASHTKSDHTRWAWPRDTVIGAPGQWEQQCAVTGGMSLVTAECISPMSGHSGLGQLALARALVFFTGTCHSRGREPSQSLPASDSPLYHQPDCQWIGEAREGAQTRDLEGSWGALGRAHDSHGGSEPLHLQPRVPNLWGSQHPQCTLRLNPPHPQRTRGLRPPHQHQQLPSMYSASSSDQREEEKGRDGESTERGREGGGWGEGWLRGSKRRKGMGSLQREGEKGSYGVCRERGREGKGWGTCREKEARGRDGEGMMLVQREEDSEKGSDGARVGRGLGQDRKGWYV